MKRKLFILLIFCLSLAAYSQMEAGNWYFGQYAGLKFNADGTRTVLTDGKLYTLEGCATLSDSEGNLLLYTDGRNVYNRNHQLMPNGTVLKGNISSTQSATIVRMPGSLKQYYIFTLDQYGETGGLCYSIVDMDLDGGLGDVAVKNVQMYTPSCEKISIVKHANGMDYWVVTHGVYNNTFYSYLLTATGVAPVMETNIGYTVTLADYHDVIGYMKISPDGTKLAVGHFLYGAQLFDFDNQTGVISNEKTILTVALPLLGLIYGVEFSPNSELLYISYRTGSPTGQPIQSIRQFNTLAADVAASAIQLDMGAYGADAMQLAPDGRIYFATVGTFHLGVINNPNVIGQGCNLQSQIVSLGDRMCHYGLPPFVTTFLSFPFTVHNLCLGSPTQFYAETAQAFNSILWDFGDGHTSTDTNPQHLYDSAGDYTVTRTLFLPGGASTKSREITISAQPVIASTANVQSVCGTNDEYYLEQLNNVLLGTQSHDLFRVSYFHNQVDALNGDNPITNNVGIDMNNQIVYYSIAALSNYDCKVVSEFQLKLYKMPGAAGFPVFMCDDPSNDGKAIFNLQALIPLTLGGQQSIQDFTVTYHLNQQDADNDIDPLPWNYENISNPQRLYTRVENNQHPACYVVLDFEIGLRRMPIPLQPNNMFDCDEGNDDSEHFLLTDQDAVILGSQPADVFKITYHISQDDADTGMNPLPGDYENTTNPQTIYARMENKLPYPTCYDTTSFTLNVRAKPAIDMPGQYAICAGTPITITAPPDFSSYAWSNGVTAQSVTITTPGNYTLTVTRNYNDIVCETTKSITVAGSSMPVITDISTGDWTDDQNTISVLAVGDGDYEYSLDGIAYQDNQDFVGLTNGEYNVFVRDKHGCGIDTKQVFLLMYPHYFTPNGDGINDYWKITFSFLEPGMQVYVYDRYGKLITGYDGFAAGWDGTLNGHPLPATDYWFVVRREDGKEYQGHFALKR